MDGLFLELGPLKLNSAGKVSLNPHSWHGVTNLLFLDQPVGTGLAYTRDKKYPRNDEEVNVAFYRMLLAFFRLHPAYTYASAQEGGGGGEGGVRISRPVILSGECSAVQCSAVQCFMQLT